MGKPLSPRRFLPQVFPLHQFYLSVRVGLCAKLMCFAHDMISFFGGNFCLHHLGFAPLGLCFLNLDEHQWGFQSFTGEWREIKKWTCCFSPVHCFSFETFQLNFCIRLCSKISNFLLTQNSRVDTVKKGVLHQELNKRKCRTFSVSLLHSCISVNAAHRSSEDPCKLLLKAAFPEGIRRDWRKECLFRHEFTSSRDSGLRTIIVLLRSDYNVRHCAFSVGGIIGKSSSLHRRSSAISPVQLQTHRWLKLSRVSRKCPAQNASENLSIESRLLFFSLSQKAPTCKCSAHRQQKSTLGLQFVFCTFWHKKDDYYNHHVKCNYQHFTNVSVMVSSSVPNCVTLCKIGWNSSWE